MAFKLASILATAALLHGCTTVNKPEAMTLMTFPGGAAPLAKYVSAICVRNVTGGEEDKWENPVGRLDTNNFRQALVGSLKNSELLAADGGCRFNLDANILGISRPAWIGSNPEISVNVNYKLYEASGKPDVLETITSNYTGSMGEASGGVDRLRLASEGAVRANITDFLRRLGNESSSQ